MSAVFVGKPLALRGLLNIWALRTIKSLNINQNVEASAGFAQMFCYGTVGRTVVLEVAYKSWNDWSTSYASCQT